MYNDLHNGSSMGVCAAIRLQTSQWRLDHERLLVVSPANDSMAARGRRLASAFSSLMPAEGTVVGKLPMARKRRTTIQLIVCHAIRQWPARLERDRRQQTVRAISREPMADRRPASASPRTSRSTKKRAKITMLVRHLFRSLARACLYSSGHMASNCL